jgi:hypothetical protein
VGGDERRGMINLMLASGTSKPQPMYVTEGVCAVARPQGEPATGNWELRCWIYTDPRIRVTYSMSALRVEKAIDQDGRELKVLPTLSTWGKVWMGPRPMANCTAAFAAAPGLKAIKELRGSLGVEVLEKTEKVKIDLTKERKEPVTTAMGKLTVEQGDNGEYTVKLEPVAVAAATGGAESPVAREVETAVEIYLVDNIGGLQQVRTDSSQRSWPVRVSNPGRTAVRLEIMLSQGARKVTLPVVFKDLEVPANTAPLPRRR